MMSSAETTPIEVLLVEDSLGDVRLTREALREANQAIHLHVACDGVEAMAFLRREGKHAHSPRPDLVLLDLNLPRMDGREVLATLVRVAELAGTFLEVETLVADEAAVPGALAELRVVLAELGVSDRELTTELYTEAVARTR